MGTRQGVVRDDRLRENLIRMVIVTMGQIGWHPTKALVLGMMGEYNILRVTQWKIQCFKLDHQ